MWMVNSVAFILAVMWGIMFLKQSREGLTSTALTDKFTWGLYIQAFFFFSALAGGILIFISIVTLFEIDSLRQLSEVGSAVSLGCLVAAGMSLSSDLGKPFRSLKIATGKNFASPLTWDFITLSICAVLNITYLTGLISGHGVGPLIWAVLCLIAALGFVIIHTLFFLSRVGAGFRSQPFLGLDTLAQSLWGGMALIALIAIAMGLKPFNIIRILLILTILVLIPLVGSFIATLTTKKSSGDEYRKIIAMDTALLVILILIQIGGPDNPVLLAIGSILILIAVFLEKSHLMRQYQAKPILPVPYSRYEEAPEYSPTAYEWMMSLGSAGACVLVASVIFYLKTSL